MKRLLMIIIVLFGLYYLLHAKYQSKEAPPQPPVLNVQQQIPPAPAISDKDLRKIRESTKDSDPTVRWAAIEFLYTVHDPQAVLILESALSTDTEPTIRKNALNILRNMPRAAATKDLTLALEDQEKEVRIAALVALGDIGDPSAAPRIAKLLNDVDPEVRLQALHTLNRFQQTKRLKYQELVDLLRRQYEDAVRKSQQKHPS